MPSSYAHGLITVAIGMADRIIIATDSTRGAQDVGIPADVDRAIQIERGFVVGGSGIWASADRRIDTARDVAATFHHGDTPESFLQRYDHRHRTILEEFLTDRFRIAPDAVLRECFCPLTPPQSLVVCQVDGDHRHATIFEYIPTLTSDDQVVLTPLMQKQEAVETAAFAAIGAAAPFLDLLDPHYVDRATRGPRGPEHAARALIEQALSRMPAALPPPRVKTFPAGATIGRTRSTRTTRAAGPAKPALRPTAAFPIVDTRDIDAVERYVCDRFAAMYPNARLSLLPTVFSDIETLFAGRHPDFAAVDLRYHDLEHTLQATLCTTLILEGRHGARVAPRIDAHHFELAVTAALLHDSGYLKLRSDNRGTGAKYTFCHVLRGCAFAASYLPNIGATDADVETVMAAINCTGPTNEISRLRFRAPVDEVIGCAVATADYLGQMAAVDYPDELTILFREFQESDEFLHVPMENRMFKTAYELIARTPQFWQRFVMPKLESDFHGVYRFLAKPFPDGQNPYLDAIEANIAEIQRRARAYAEAHPVEAVEPISGEKPAAGKSTDPAWPESVTPTPVSE